MFGSECQSDCRDESVIFTVDDSQLARRTAVTVLALPTSAAGAETQRKCLPLASNYSHYKGKILFILFYFIVLFYYKFSCIPTVQFVILSQLCTLYFRNL